MADITKCASEECKLGDKCRRKTEKTGFNQSFCFFKFKYNSKLDEEKCKWFLESKLGTFK